jgi:hypothetical protein
MPKNLNLNILMHDLKPMNKLMKIQQMFNWHFPLFSSKFGKTIFLFIFTRYWMRVTRNTGEIAKCIPLVHFIPVELPTDF